MKPRDIEKLYAATRKKSAGASLVDFWESVAERIRQERAATRAELDRPDIGWSLALQLAHTGKWPATLKKPAFRWLRKAVALLEAPHRTKKDSDLQIVDEARLLHENGEFRPLLQAALLTRGATAESVAAALGIEPLLVEAYDTLFFNVLDHKADIVYLSNAVRHALTPRGWLYMAENVDEDHQALLNAGLNGSLQDVLYLAGFATDGDEANESPAEKLVRKVVSSASAWIAANRGQDNALPLLVSKAIEIAKKAPGPSESDIHSTQLTTGTFYEIVSAQLESDVASLNEKVARAAGMVPGKPKTQALPVSGVRAYVGSDFSASTMAQKTKPVSEVVDGITCGWRLVYRAK